MAPTAPLAAMTTAMMVNETATMTRASTYVRPTARMLLANCQVETLKASESQYARWPGRVGLAVPFVDLCQCQC